MTIATSSHTAITRGVQEGRKEGRKAPGDVPYLLPLIEQGGDEQQVQSPVADLALHVIRLVAQRLPVAAASPLCWTEQVSQEQTWAEQVSSTLTTCLQQGFRRLLLVPWGGRQHMGSLVEPARRALSPVTGEVVSQTERVLPHVHVDGVSVRSTFEGLSSIQAQLGPLLEAFPGWDRTWIRLWAGQAKMVLLRSGASRVQPFRTAAWEMPTMKALTAALCPQHVEFMTVSERSRWQQDGQIYAHYLVSLLCAATEFLQQEPV